VQTSHVGHQPLSLPSEVGPLTAATRSGGALWLSQRVRAEPGRQTLFGELKISPLVATIFSSFKVMHRLILSTRFCKLAILSGGHVPQVPQWHGASAFRSRSYTSHRVRRARQVEALFSTEVCAVPALLSNTWLTPLVSSHH